jgi:hypothetical protein
MGLTTVLVGWVLMRLVAVGQGRVVVLVLMAGSQMRPVLPAAQIVGHMDVLVVVDLGIVAVLLSHGRLSHPKQLGADTHPPLSTAAGHRLWITRR